MRVLNPDISSSGLRVGLLEEDNRVGVVELTRPNKANAFDGDMFALFPKAISSLCLVPSVRCLLICARGEGPFCAGIDTSYLQGMLGEMRRVEAGGCPGRAREHLRSHILDLQEAFTSMEKCKWPVVAAVHGACIGGGVDLVAAADIRVASRKATFCVKGRSFVPCPRGILQSVKGAHQKGLSADALAEVRVPWQQLKLDLWQHPFVYHAGQTADLALTARSISASEALSLGLVSQVIGDDNATLMLGAKELAKNIASKSPMALVGTKRTLLHRRDSANSVPSELEYVATHNAAMLVSEDLMQAVQARGRPTTFSKL